MNNNSTFILIGMLGGSIIYAILRIILTNIENNKDYKRVEEEYLKQVLENRSTWEELEIKRKESEEKLLDLKIKKAVEAELKKRGD